jgi:sulfur carrier protein
VSHVASETATREIEIEVNGERLRVAEGSTVEGLVEQLGLRGRKIAVAVNREVVPRSAHRERALAGGDRVEVLEAVGGG